ncbi:MAG: hypothetical protein LBH09_03115, partial [Peptococcaceae bacterium]|jgi:hypothetical protein|nr:hypothetical protein [Peptococcaceae bacterium]
MYFTLNVNADPPIQDIENEQNGQASLSGQDGQSGQGSLSGQNRQENQASLSGQDSQANLSEQNGQGNLDGAVMVGASAPDWLNGKSISIFIIALGIVTAILLKR